VKLRAAKTGGEVASWAMENPVAFSKIMTAQVRVVGKKH